MMLMVMFISIFLIIISTSYSVFDWSFQQKLTGMYWISDDDDDDDDDSYDDSDNNDDDDNDDDECYDGDNDDVSVNTTSSTYGLTPPLLIGRGFVTLISGMCYECSWIVKRMIWWWWLWSSWWWVMIMMMMMIVMVMITMMMSMMVINIINMNDVSYRLW